MILSICIPAFNQAADLRQTLHGLSTLKHLAALKLSGEVEVLVSNNNSTDGTGAIENDPVAKDVRWFNQLSNLGFAGNVEFLARSAEGSFVWVVGCGEKVVSRNFESLVDYLRTAQRGGLTHMVLGATAVDENGEVTDTYNEDPLAKPREVLKGSTEMPYSEAISQTVWRRQTLESGFTAPFSTGNSWPHVEVVLRLIEKNGERAYRFDKEFVILRRTTDGWWSKSDSHRYLIEYANLLERSSSARAAYVAIEKVYRNLINFAIARWILMLKASGKQITPRQPFRLAKSIQSLHPLRKSLIFLAASTPTALVRTAARVIKHAKKLGNRNKRRA